MQFSLGSLCPSILRLIGLRCPIKKARTLALAKPDLKERCTLPKVGTVLYRLRMSMGWLAKMAKTRLSAGRLLLKMV